eukprot:3609999-Pleurochrysis_carterae.AAC.1
MRRRARARARCGHGAQLSALVSGNRAVSARESNGHEWWLQPHSLWPRGLAPYACGTLPPS